MICHTEDDAKIETSFTLVSLYWVKSSFKMEPHMLFSSAARSMLKQPVQLLSDFG